MSKPATPVEDRIAEHVELDTKTGCWRWVGPTHSSGYPMLKVAGQKELIRPILYRMAFGEPRSKLTARPQVRMECGRQDCVCPEHMVVIDDEHRELLQLRGEIYQQGFRRFRQNPSDPKLRRLVSSGYINWKAKTIMEERRQAREAAKSPEVQVIVNSLRRKATIIGAAPT